MMKKRTALVLVVVAFVAGFLLSSLVPLSHAVEKDTIDRTPYVLYPSDQYKTRVGRMALLFLDDKYYHHDKNCPFIIGKEQGTHLRVSLYEAVERGFTACPNCVYELVRIKEN